MKKLITVLLAFLMSLIPTLTRTQPTVLQADTYESTAVTESTYELTVDSKTESLVMATAEPKVIATETPVAPFDTLCDEIPTEPEAVPDTEEPPPVSEQSEDSIEPSTEQAATETDHIVPFIAQNEEESKTNTNITEEETSNDVTCIDNGNSGLAPYTPVDGQETPNPFVNALPTDIIEIDAEDLIQPGDDRPGEGIHF